MVYAIRPVCFLGHVECLHEEKQGEVCNHFEA
jgi:hypothetical protein